MLYQTSSFIAMHKNYGEKGSSAVHDLSSAIETFSYTGTCSELQDF
jgi:hypothetical protein